MAGKSLENLFRYSDAVKMQQNALKLAPEAKEVAATLASLYMQSGQALAAAKLYEQLSNRDPSENLWTMRRASALKAASRTKEALLLFVRLAKIEDADWQIFRNAGDCYLAIDSLEQARLHYERALELYPNNVALRGQLASLYLRMNNLLDAEKTAIKSLEYDSTFIEGLRYAGIAIYRQNRADAIEYFNRAMALGDSSKTVVWYSAMLRYRTADFIRAEKMIRKALSYEPDNPNFLYYMAVTLDALGKYKEATACLDSMNFALRHIDSLRINADIQSGKTYRNMGQTDKAANVFKKLAERLPDRPVHIYDVASTYDIGGRKREALIWYKRFLDKIAPGWENEPVPAVEGIIPTYKIMAQVRMEAIKVQLFYEEKKDTQKENSPNRRRNNRANALKHQQSLVVG